MPSKTASAPGWASCLGWDRLAALRDLTPSLRFIPSWLCSTVSDSPLQPHLCIPVVTSEDVERRTSHSARPSPAIRSSHAK